MAIQIGQHLGPYEILAAIGAGGMGEVYRARDTRLDRVVAIKILPDHLASRAELRDRFDREARTVASLNHSHICMSRTNRAAMRFSAAGTPRVLFDGPYESAPFPIANYDVSTDGQRFLMLKPVEQTRAAPTQINVVQNWFEELKQKVPTGKK